ncbi:MAG: hypothetical protein AB8G22_26880 [Saprospiraceae bacterium]
MEVYNQNEEFINYNVEYLNGYLTSIALLRDYTNGVVGFNYFFKKIGEGNTIDQAIKGEIKWALAR